MNLDDFLETKRTKKKSTNWIYILIPIICLVMVGCFFFFKKEKPFELRGLTSTCDNFNLYGSIAYNDSLSSIYISNITYCGESDPNRYQKIECTLYETNGKTKTEISKYHTQNDSLITLDAFLQNVKFSVDNYAKSCKVYLENSLHLEIEATDEFGKLITYKIPLKLEECH